MSVQLTGVGGLFSRFGAIGTEFNRAINNLGSALNTGVSGIWVQYPVAANEGQAISNLINAANTSRNSNNAYLQELQSEATNTLLQQVNRDVPLAPYTTNNALGVLIVEMVASGQTVQRPTTSTSISPYASNKGNPVIAASLANNLGDPLDLVVAENVNVACTADVSNGAQQFSEVFTYNGEPALPINNYLWPQGSGANGTFKLTDAAVTGLITDGSFQSWTGISNNTPVYWTIVNGASTISRCSVGADVLRGNYTMQVTSDGSTLFEFQQALTGVQPLTVYAVNFWAKVSTTDASGQLRIRLCNGAGTTLQNFDGTNLTSTIGTNGGSGVGTSFAAFTYFWQTPRQLPTSGSVFLDFAYTTSPVSAVVLFIDLVGIAPATQLYSSGPYIAGFSQSAPSARGDYYTLTVANNAPQADFGQFTNRMFGMSNSGLYFPSANSPTIPNSLFVA